MMLSKQYPKQEKKFRKWKRKEKDFRYIYKLKSNMGCLALII